MRHHERSAGRNKRGSRFCDFGCLNPHETRPSRALCMTSAGRRFASRRVHSIRRARPRVGLPEKFCSLITRGGLSTRSTHDLGARQQRFKAKRCKRLRPATADAGRPLAQKKIGVQPAGAKKKTGGARAALERLPQNYWAQRRRALSSQNKSGKTMETITLRSLTKIKKQVQRPGQAQRFAECL